MSTFTVAGVSTLNGQVKVRFANDMTRVKNLQKSGHLNINLLPLPNAMSKAEIVAFLKTTDLYTVVENREAIDSAYTKYNEVNVVKVTKAKAAKAAPSIEAIKARAAATDAVAE